MSTITECLDAHDPKPGFTNLLDRWRMLSKQVCHPHFELTVTAFATIAYTYKGLKNAGVEFDPLFDGLMTYLVRDAFSSNDGLEDYEDTFGVDGEDVMLDDGFFAYCENTKGKPRPHIKPSILLPPGKAPHKFSIEEVEHVAMGGEPWKHLTESEVRDATKTA